MKKLLIIYCFLVATTLGMNAQEYIPLLSNSNEWKLTTCFFGCLTDTYFTDGDTIVNGTNFKILDGYHYISRKFLLREDISKKQVHIKMFLPNGVEDYLLYDFSLKVGDSFQMANPITPFPQDGGMFDLDSIVSRVLADNNPYRHFYFSPSAGNTVSTDNAIWIEGVGSLSIINAPGGYPDINQVGHLSCAFKNGIKVYEKLDSITKCTPDILSVYEGVDALETIRMYQKNDYLFLENASNVVTVTIYDIAGKKIEDRLHTPKSTLFSLNTSTMSSGLYLASILTSEGMQKTFKFIKN